MLFVTIWKKVSYYGEYAGLVKSYDPKLLVLTVCTGNIERIWP